MLIQACLGGIPELVLDSALVLVAFVLLLLQRMLQSVVQYHKACPVRR